MISENQSINQKLLIYISVIDQLIEIILIFSHKVLRLANLSDLSIVIESIDIKYRCVYNAILQGLIVPK